MSADYPLRSRFELHGSLYRRRDRSPADKEMTLTTGKQADRAGEADGSRICGGRTDLSLLPHRRLILMRSRAPARQRAAEVVSAPFAVQQLAKSCPTSASSASPICRTPSHARNIIFVQSGRRREGRITSTKMTKKPGSDIRRRDGSGRVPRSAASPSESNLAAQCCTLARQ